MVPIIGPISPRPFHGRSTPSGPLDGDRPSYGVGLGRNTRPRCLRPSEDSSPHVSSWGRRVPDRRQGRKRFGIEEHSELKHRLAGAVDPVGGFARGRNHGDRMFENKRGSSRRNCSCPTFPSVLRNIGGPIIVIWFPMFEATGAVRRKARFQSSRGPKRTLSVESRSAPLRRTNLNRSWADRKRSSARYIVP